MNTRMRCMCKIHYLVCGGNIQLLKVSHVLLVPLLNIVHLDCLIDLENATLDTLGVIKYIILVN